MCVTALHFIDTILTVLAQFEVPAWVARLPTLVGIPAGGSLTGGEYKMLMTAFGVPVVTTKYKIFRICFH